MRTRQSDDNATGQFIADVRHFNRFYTRQLGLLDRYVLDSPFTLAEMRVLYELARRETTTASAIAADLGLDVGYLSRILTMFERRRFIKRERSSADSRQVIIRLTGLGRQRFLPLDKAARIQIANLIDPLAVDRRHRLVESMRTIEGMLSGAEVAAQSYRLRGLRPGDLGWITHRQALLYHQEFGWDSSYEALVADILSRFLKTFDAATESAWIAERGQEVLGSVFLVRASEKLAKLRLLYVEPSARGLGIGRRLVDECIAFARAKDYETLTLWTNDVLVSARKIYQAAGFRLTGEERHHSFGKDLVGQTWKLALRVNAATSNDERAR